MLNRPVASLNPSDGSAPRPVDFDHHPELRLAVLFAGIAAMVIVFIVRVAYLQLVLAPEFKAVFTRTTQRYEEISTQDGRILAARQEPLAYDEDVYTLAVHYGWLQDPVDSRWLEEQARKRLTGREKRNRQKLQAEMQLVLNDREQVWERLSTLTGASAAELRHRRRAIQRRVEQIHASVVRRRLEAAQSANKANALNAANANLESSLSANSNSNDAGASANDPSNSSSSSQTLSIPTGLTGWLQRWYGNTVSELTANPDQNLSAEVVVTEQLDYHEIARDLTLDAVAEVESHPRRYPGVIINVATRRVYPQGTLAPHVVGYRKSIDAETLELRKQEYPAGDPLDYATGDRIGIAGIEKQYDRALRGLRGRRSLTFNSRGEIIAREITRLPRPGRDVVLTLNHDLQAAAQQLLDEALSLPKDDPVSGLPLPIPRGGSIVAIDVASGAVLAAVSAPGFDLATLASQDRSAYAEMLADSRAPQFNRFAAAGLPPGSVFKVVTAAAVLETGIWSPEREFDCQGYLSTPDRHRCAIFRNFGVGHGPVSLVDAVSRSCNVYFFAAAKQLGTAPIADWADRFGLGHRTEIDIPGEITGFVPGQFSARAGSGRATSTDASALQLAIGQDRLQVTPLQIARLMAAIANGGELVRPHLVDSIGAPILVSDGGSDTLESEPPQAFGTQFTDPEPIAGLSTRTLAWLRRGLEAVVADPGGTGFKTVKMPGISIAGKTGTAETGGGRPDHAWFAGYVPANRPQIAFVVVLEHAGSGGHAAGPIARELVEAMLRCDVLTVDSEANVPRMPTAN